MQVQAEDPPLTSAELDTLVALVEHGPLLSGEIPSAAGRFDLVKRGFAFQTLVRGEEGYWAVTNAGVQAYKQRYGMAGFDVEITLAEAKAGRQAQKSINQASYGLPRQRKNK